jgi:DNA-binding response OmpR family regulator
MEIMRYLLLVEDEPNLAELLKEAFEQIGYNVLSSDRMDSALVFFKKEIIEIIVTDFHIKQGSGRRLLYEVRKIDTVIPVFLMTGTPFVSEEDFRVYGFEKVFLKPFPLHAICDEVKRIWNK